MDVGYGTIVDAIKKFSTSVQEIEKFKIEKIERITSQMLQNEKENRQMVLHSQLQIATIFAQMLKPKKGGLNN